jgi:5-methylcytosine-specific restriction protein A
MPMKPKHLCFYSGCGTLTDTTYCPKHTEVKKQARRDYDKKRPSYYAWYDSARWQMLRSKILFACPLCVECSKLGRHTSASVVDHIVAHKGNINLFWDAENLQSLCKTCHSAKTSKEDSWNKK